MRTRVFFTVVIAALFVATASAHAKGADGATVEGEGLDAPIAVSGYEGDGGNLGMLAERTGFYASLFETDPDPMLDAAPTTKLGPRLVITWHMPTGSTTADEIAQDVYPWADGGPLTYMSPSQLFAGQPIRGGWFQAESGLLTTLGQLGVPSREAYEAAAAPPSTVAPRPGPAPTAPNDDPTSIAWPLVGTVAGCIALGGSVMLGRQMTRRRARTVPA